MRLPILCVCAVSSHFDKWVNDEDPPTPPPPPPPPSREREIT